MARARGEGMLTHKPSRKLWVARWQGREVTSRTKAGAARKLKELRDKGAVDDARLSVAGYLRWWVDEHLVHRVAFGKITESTRQGYEKYVRCTWRRRAQRAASATSGRGTSHQPTSRSCWQRSSARATPLGPCSTSTRRYEPR
ncbi:MAG: hypothetical protein M3N52_07550 [Actinomycetota bacterium]|nr:hypothetical protein [Actinomycetota bacterium]